MLRRLTNRIAPVLGAAAAVAMAAASSSDAQQVGAGQSVTDLMIQSRSQEQPQSSARRIPLPAGNTLEVLHVLGTVYMIAGGPSNIAVQIGSEGVLLVDSGTEAVSDQVLQAIRALSDGAINYIINTTVDKDHFGGNGTLGAAGQNPTIAGRGLTGRVVARPNPDGTARDDTPGGGAQAALRPQGAIVFSHENMLNRLSAPTGVTPPEPFALWPTSTFFTRQKTLSFNDEAIEMLHQPAAHTDADLLVFFRRSDVVAAGDIINTLQYPAFDARRGGSIQGILDGLNAIIELTVPRFNQMAGTRVIPGHGRILNEADVVEYRDMMTIIRDRIKDGIDEGKTLAQIKALRPTLDYDPLYSVPAWTGEMLIEAIHADLRKPVSATAAR
jgi:glyoxylase-like metal-dependent hydrolase (beta-lactamase superfamily II)